MEVHHHSQHSSHKKKFKEHILEFFMLFLAVSLGFLAENIREHFIEKERAHELLHSFIKDVESNVSFTDSLFKSNRKMLIKNDSSMVYLLENKQISLDSFYSYFPLGSFRYLNNNDTYDQMRSSGSLRYIKDTILLRMIINYNTASRSAEFRSVTQEYEYVAHEYTEAMQNWMPPEIAAKRHATAYVTNKAFSTMLENENDKALMHKLYHKVDNKIFLLKGESLEKMKNELIPVIARKTYLMSASMRTALIVNEQAKDLLIYYKRTAGESE